MAPGLNEIEAGLRELHQMGAGRFEPLHLSLAADAYASVGRHGEARASIGKAFAALADGRDLALAAELHRTRAVLLLRADSGERGAAEADLRRALEIGRQQEALSLQLRAARDLARLWAERGERQQAADLLEGVYREFKEGFDTPDLTEAKALLNELHA
jgi:predicted ATPase